MNWITKTLICIWAFIMPMVVSAQNTQWITPKCNNNINSNGLTVEKVDFYSDATIVKLKYDNRYRAAGWVQLSRACKLKAYPSGQTYTLTSAEGIPYAPTKHHFYSEKETLTFTCRFPAVPAGTTSIDWIEEDNWVIRNIKSTYETSVSHSAGRKFVSNSSTSSTSYRGAKTITVGKSISTAYHTWTLKQIDLTSSKTVCKWSVTPKQRDTYIQMSQGVYLIDNKGKKYYMVSCDGISMAPKQDPIYAIRTVDFTATFPAIDEDATSVTYFSSSSFQIRDISINGNQAFTYGSSNQNVSNYNNDRNFDITNSTSYTAYASSFCYPTGNDTWSEFSEWKNCDFAIEYNADDRHFIFYLKSATALIR